MKYKWYINFEFETGDVVTQDGEIVGRWDTDDSDAFYQFYEIDSNEVRFFDPHMGSLAKKIAQWLKSN